MTADFIDTVLKDNKNNKTDDTVSIIIDLEGETHYKTGCDTDIIAEDKRNIKAFDTTATNASKKEEKNCKTVDSSGTKPF
jgi:hypothetical protein